jgi:cyclomaltodextrinase
MNAVDETRIEEGRKLSKFSELQPIASAGRCSKWISRGVAGAALLLVNIVGAHEIPVRFATHGGDAWQFEKTLEIVVPENHCDHVTIASPTAHNTFKPVNGRVEARVALRTGKNRIRAECDENGAVRGVAWQTWRLRLHNAPSASIQISQTSVGIALDGSGTTQAPVGGSAITRYQWLARQGNPAPFAGLPSRNPKINLSISAPDGEYYIKLKVTDASRRIGETTIMLRSEGGLLHTVDVDHTHPAWVDRAAVYGVVPALFGKRGLADVTAQLDRLSTLGITVLWLSPITDSAPGDFGYAVTDYFRTRAGLGGAAQLHELVRAAHARGMHVILDFVPNHLSDRARYFVDTIEHNRFSPYYDFFTRDRSGNAQHYFDWRNLENLNYANPEVQNLVIEGFAHWVREFDIDGFRVDAAWGPKQRAPDFWPRWRSELKRIKPDLLLLAEASARDPYYGQHGFDAAYDWTDKLGEWAWQGAFEDGPNTAQRLREAIAFPESDALVFRFLENNDTGARFITRYGPARTRVAAAMLLTLPGIPSLYTGQEIGAAYEPYNRAAPLVWKDTDSLQCWYQRLISLRRAHPALRSPGLRLLDVAPRQSVLAYVRHSEAPVEDIVVILNLGDSTSRVVFAEKSAQSIRQHSFADLLTGSDVAFDDPVVEVAPHSAKILKAK